MLKAAESRKIRAEVSVGYGNMEARVTLERAASMEGRSPLQQIHQVPSLCQAPPLTGRSQPEWAVSAEEQNLRVDAFQTSVCEGRRNGNVKKGGESLKKDFIAE